MYLPSFYRSFLILASCLAMQAILVRSFATAPSTNDSTEDNGHDVSKIPPVIQSSYSSAYQVPEPILGVPIITVEDVKNGQSLDGKQAVTLPKTATTNLTRFYIRSTGYPSPIPQGDKVTWKVVRSSSAVCRLKLTYELFNIEASDKCSKDVFLIDSNGLLSSQCGVKSGQIQIVNFPKEQQEAVLTYTDDGTGDPNPGFQILVSQETVNCSTGSGATTAQVFYIESKDFRTKTEYDANLTQTWTIIRNSSSVCALQLRFDTFGLQGPTENVCSNDYLEYTDNAINRRQCGSLNPGSTRMVGWPKSQPEFIIKFVSDDTINDRGFSILVSQQLNSC